MIIVVLFVIFLCIILVGFISSIETSTWILIGVVAVLVIAAAIALKFILSAMRKPVACSCCQQETRGVDQEKWGWGGPNSFIICKQCATRVNPQIVPYAKEHWSYKDFADYLNWEEETKKQRSQFVITEKYGSESVLMVDNIHNLFSIGRAKLIGNGQPGMIFRFEDLADFDLDFKPDEIKEGVLGNKVRGTEYANITLCRPVVNIEVSLNSAAEYSLRKKGLLSSKYEYDMSEEFLKVISAFTICASMELAKKSGTMSEENQSFDEVQKALALFMFESMADVTEDNLKKQRNALIKAFHPDAGENNEAYSQKINAAYDLLKSMIQG